MCLWQECALLGVRSFAVSGVSGTRSRVDPPARCESLMAVTTGQGRKKERRKGLSSANGAMDVGLRIAVWLVAVGKKKWDTNRWAR